MLRKVTIISVIFLATFIFSRTGFCVPAVSSTRQIEQPDGKTFTARLWGDEKAHGWETTDGYTIVRDPDTNFWRYAQKEASTGRMLPAGIVGAENANVGLSRHLRPAASTTILRNASSSADSMQPRSINHTPVTGSRPIPVMMVNFNNTAATFDASDFESMLFGTGTQSMKDYYEEVSYGAFSVSSGPAGVTGWYTAAQPHDYYGQNDVDGYDKYPAKLVIETVTAADASIDFSEYDSDGDCYVDAVVIVHQGSGEEAWGPTTDIWSHQWDLYSASWYGDGTGVYTTNDVAACGNIKINDYVIQPETLYGGIQTVGVFAHEYGHVLGLPDLYDIDYSSNGIGNWGLMAGGAWGAVHRPGDSPVHMSAWSKYMLGWVNPMQVSTKLTDEIISPASAYADVYQIFPDNQTNSQEYYLIENRQRTGFDAGLPGTGLAIWHIDENMASYYNYDNKYECTDPGNCADSHYRVALVQADGYWDLETGYNRGDAGDLYPGSSGNSDFTSETDPDNLLYDGSPSHVAISNITESGTNVTASLSLAYSITPSTVDGGTISPGAKTIVDRGDDITFAITPNAGYQISQVVIDGASVGAVAEYTFADTQIDHEISAVFTATNSNASASSGGGSGGGGCFISSTF